MKKLRVLYRTIIERERILACINVRGDVQVVCSKLSGCAAADEGVVTICLCEDLASAFRLKSRLSTHLLIFYTSDPASMFSLLEDERTLCWRIGSDKSDLKRKLSQLTDHRCEVGERASYLTHREIEVIRLLVGGLDNAQIARRLGIKLSTVVAHKKNLFLKSGTKNTSQLVVWALLKGWDQKSASLGARG